MKLKLMKPLAVFMALNILAETLFPTIAYALTGGPSQPEVQSFEPVGTTEMVDLFSGDFVYNIPLLDVDGYPINISYHSGITMDQEASWVGLGWNINPGVINRNMRGLPDDFKGQDDEVVKDMYVKDNFTYGLNLGASFEVFGFDLKKIKVRPNISVSLGVFYNNYKGVGFEQSITPSINAGDKLKLTGALSISGNTQSGMTISPSTGLGLSWEMTKIDATTVGTFSFSVGSSYNSRSGVKSLTFSKGLSFKKYGNSESMKEREKHVSAGSNNGGSSLSYASQSYIPQISMSMTNFNVSFNAKLGADALASNPALSVSGYYSNQSVAETQVKKEAYGYLYSTAAQWKGNIMMDVNREKDGAYSANNKNLPITTFSHDLYAVSGQGIGGMFRPYRGDIGHLHDDEMTSDGNGGSIGGEAGAGNLSKWGASLTYNHSSSKSGKWSSNDGNGLEYVFTFKSKNEAGGNPLYEDVYFKNAGEKTLAETGFLPYKELSSPLRPAFDTYLYSLSYNLRGDKLIKADGNEIAVDIAKRKEVPITNASTYKQKREPRNQLIQYLTASESNLCLENQIRSYVPNNFTFMSGEVTSGNGKNVDIINRTDANRKEHHITEVTALNPGGVRYVYGIPAYNTNQEEITFTTADQSCSDLVTYDPGFYTRKRGADAAGLDGYYNATTLKPYAHSYLLTAVLSPDYVDLGERGPSKEDLGTYTKINYSRVSDDYKWRTPYEENKALFNGGMLADDFDNKATIIYGSKEVWHVHSIESKNYIALFDIGVRRDGKATNSVHGGAATTGDKHYSYYLKSIRLFSKSDFGEASVPIKTVHFEYDYSLCPGVKNNTGEPTYKDGSPITNQAEIGNPAININSAAGKLTLKRIYFTYGNSQKGKFNTYQFSYNSGTEKNPGYVNKGYDRWGNYKPGQGCYTQDNPNGPRYPGNAEFPYTPQTVLENDYAQAWSLTEIGLPSGGKIKVTYESDDYAYVQNKKAMEMFFVNGFSANGTGTVSNELYNSTGVGNNYVHINLKEACAGVGEFIRDYLPEQTNAADQTRYLFFNFLTYVKGNSGKQEFVRGYAEIDYTYPSYVKAISSTEFAVKVKNVSSDPESLFPYAPQTSPFSIAALQLFRISLPQLVYPGSDMNKAPDGGALAIRSLLGVFFDIFEAISGINDKLLQDNFAKHVVPTNSWVRLMNGNGKKKGGGARVKKIELSDEWNTMNIGSNPSSPIGKKSTYGQEYEYTTVDAYGRTISSGVASYEPGIGNDENPFRQPIMSKKENALVPDETFYMEEPLGESFFPSPSVGYSKVTTKNLSIEIAGETNIAKGTGKLVNEFYTTKDFPTLVSRTNTQVDEIKPDWLGGLFSLQIFNQASVSQGYQIELNDMNGKPKAEWVYAENLMDINKQGKLISGKEYIYYTDPDNPAHLNNHVKAISPDGSVVTDPDALLGVDAEMIFDTRTSYSKTFSIGVDVNSDILIPWVITWCPVPFPNYNADISNFRSATLTRVIQRYGILHKTIVRQDDAMISTENMAFDAQTGEVLLTKTQNEYKDPLYNLTYPAHWAYDGMGQAYKNWGVVLSVSTNSSGVVNFGSNVGIIQMGDEVSINKMRYWFQDGKFIDKSGNAYIGTTAFDVKVVRSFRRNQQNEAIASFVMKKDPLATSNNVRAITHSNNLINAGSSLFSEDWKPYCNTTSATVCNNCNLGDFDSKQLVQTLNYLFKMNLIVRAKNLQTTGISGNQLFRDTSYTVLIPQDLTVLPEYTQYHDGFIARNFNNYGLTHKVLVHYQQAELSNQADLTFTFEYCKPGTYVVFGFKEYINSCNPITSSQNANGLVYGNGVLTLGSGGYTLNGTITGTMLFDTNPACSTTFELYEGYYTPDCDNYCINIPPNVPNKYLNNNLGVWRKKKDLLFLDTRIPADNTHTNIRIDGTYRAFTSLWDYSTSSNWWEPNYNNWVWTTETTHYVGEGMEVENRDALNRYNSALFDERRLPVAVANNAERREIGFDGFEDYPDLHSANLCPDKHWNFKLSPTSYVIDNSISHSGTKSLKLNFLGSVENTYFLRGCEPEMQGTNYTFPTTQCADCVLPFSPYPGKKYVISGWTRTLRTSNKASYNVSNRDSRVEITYKGLPYPNVALVITPVGPVIEGWQRFEAEFTIPLQAMAIQVRLLPSPDEGKNTWFDDVRIYPFNGNMKTHVYHPYTNRLMATHDENNYATFYEYDLQGALRRVKKETERGIMTIQESRNHFKPNN